MSRDPFAFLATESRDRLLLILLQAVVKKQGGELSLSLTDVTAIDDGAGLFRKTSDDGTSLVLSFARKGAEAYFLAEGESSPQPTSRKPPIRNSIPRRSVVHDDLDLALLEEERMSSTAEHQRKADIESRRQSGAMPWVTRQPS